MTLYEGHKCTDKHKNYSYKQLRSAKGTQFLGSTVTCGSTSKKYPWYTDTQVINEKGSIEESGFRKARQGRIWIISKHPKPYQKEKKCRTRIRAISNRNRNSV